MFALAIPGVVVAQTEPTRTEKKRPVIGWLDVAVLGAGIGGSIALMNKDTDIATRLQTDKYQENDRYQDISSVAGTFNEKSLFAAGLVTYGIAKLAHAPRTTTDIAWHTTESIFIASASFVYTEEFGL